MAPSPVSDRLLLLEHEYYNTGDLRLVLPFIQSDDASSKSLPAYILLGIMLLLILGVILTKQRHSVLTGMNFWLNK